MNLEQQCVSLYLAKRLKELEVKQESLFYWADGSIVVANDYELLLKNGKVRTFSCLNNAWPDQDVGYLYSAFTVAEILEILPSNIPRNNDEFFHLTIYKEHGWFGIYYTDQIENIAVSEEIKLVNACANMLIHLLENGLIKNET